MRSRMCKGGVRVRAAVVLAFLVAAACTPPVEIRSPLPEFASTANADACRALIIGTTGRAFELDPTTLDQRGTAVDLPARALERRVSLRSRGWYADTLVVFEERGASAEYHAYEARPDEWYVAVALPPLPQPPACDDRGAAGDVAYVIIANGGRPAPAPASGLPSSGPSDFNTFVAAVSTSDGVEQWRVALPARAGYYPALYGSTLNALLPAAALSPDGRTVAVTHSATDGSDELSLVDVATRSVRTMRLRDQRPTMRLGPAVAEAKVLEAGKTWSPRYVDAQHLYALLREISSSEPGDVSALLIDMADGHIIRRWPEHADVRIHGWISEWTYADGSLLIATRATATGPYTIYRLDRELTLRARRSSEVPVLLTVSPRQ
jgi:hypothetical protein